MKFYRVTYDDVYKTLDTIEDRERIVKYPSIKVVPCPNGLTVYGFAKGKKQIAKVKVMIANKVLALQRDFIKKAYENYDTTFEFFKELL